MVGMKSIRFPPPVADEMVRATLEGCKTVTRRVVKAQEPDWKFLSLENDPYMTRINRNGEEYPSQETGLWAVFEWGAEFPLVKVPYRPGDILYVRETWRIWRAHRYDADAHIEFRAGGEGTVIQFPYGCTDFANRDDYDRFIHKWGVRENKWHPSIHMPREAARIFLRVTDVRVERLQEIDGRGILAEGVDNGRSNPAMGKRWENMQRMAFQGIWNSAIKKADRALYGWEANPWVWVIGFERCEKPEGG